MKNTHRVLFAIVVTISLALTVVSTYGLAQDSTVITKRELKALLKTAKDAAEHQKIAAYYRHEAARSAANAKEHAEMATIYAKNPPFPAMEAKHGSAFGRGAAHCKRLAELYSEQAKEADALAILHEDMAKSYELKQ